MQGARTSPGPAETAPLGAVFPLCSEWRRSAMEADQNRSILPTFSTRPDAGPVVPILEQSLLFRATTGTGEKQTE
jgi:hypothetical protein